MIFNLLYITVAVLSFCIIFMTLNSVYRGNKFNWPFILIILFVGLQRLLFSLKEINIINFQSPLIKDPLMIFFVIPFFYMFFHYYNNSNSFVSKNLLHLIFPTFLYFLLKFEFFHINLIKSIIFCYCLIYLIMSYYQIVLYNKVNGFNYKTMDNTSRFLAIVFINLTLLTLFLNYKLITWNGLVKEEIFENFYPLSSIIWILIFLIILSNPIIIYGQGYLMSVYKEDSFSSLNVWNNFPSKIDPIDLNVYRKIKRSIPLIMLRIYSIENDYVFLSKNALNIKIISQEIHVPVSHVKFIFKYFCKYSLHKYLNYLKIKYSLWLIKKDFLINNSIEELGRTCHFKSRITFFNNFKEFTGKSPSKYLN